MPGQVARHVDLARVRLVRIGVRAVMAAAS
ncbi:Uncharacterised protein [Bordetella pertussis]|nr:Uncharacterised protein [Bordetella pertussis]